MHDYIYMYTLKVRENTGNVENAADSANRVSYWISVSEVECIFR